METEGNDDVVNNAADEAGIKGGGLKRTLADYYPDPLGTENADKDPELTDDIVISKTEAETDVEIAEIKTKYQKSCQLRRQIYQQIDLAIRDKHDDLDIDALEEFLDCAQRTLFRLDNLHSELSTFGQTKGQKQTFTRHSNQLKELIEYLTDLMMKKLKAELSHFKTREQQNPNNAVGIDQVSNVDTEDDVGDSSDDGSLNLGRGGERFAGYRFGNFQRGAVRGGRYQRRNPDFGGSPVCMTPAQFGKLFSAVKPDKNEPNTRGLDKHKIPFFDGDTELFYFWKKKFDLAHANRNLQQADLALRLHGYLKGPAKSLVDCHLTGEWEDDDYDRIVEILEGRYGGEFKRDEIIVSKLANAPVFKDFSLKSLDNFYQLLTMQKVYYRKNDPACLANPNSNLFHTIRLKMSAFTYQKFADWCKDKSRRETIDTLHEWVKDRVETVQKTETLLGKGKKSSERVVLYGEEVVIDDSEEKVESEDQFWSDDDDVCFTLEGKYKGKQVEFNLKKNKTYSISNSRPQGQKASFKPSKPTQCPVCLDTSHELFVCPKFKKLNARQRYAVVKTNQACYHCLKRGHPSNACNYEKGKLCGIDGCTRYEHPLLHFDKSVGDVAIGDWCDEFHGHLTWTEEDSSCLTGVFHLAKAGTISLQTVVCKVGASNGRPGFTTVAMLDTGANTTCIDEDLAKRLKLPVRRGPVDRTIHLLDCKTKIKSYLVDVQLTSADGLLSQTITAWTVKDLTKNTGVVDWSVEKLNFPHLRKIPFTPLPKEAAIQLLIGTDNVSLFTPDNPVKSEDGTGPIAYKIPLGWTCLGPSSNPDSYDLDEVYTSVESMTQK